MPLDIIMDDLRHTHSLEVTIDNILQGNIAVPSVSTPKKIDEQGLDVREIWLLILFKSFLRAAHFKEIESMIMPSWLK